MTSVRKLFLDSRFAQGTPGDFTVQLPRAVVTKRGQVLSLTSISFPNHFETVMPGYNDLLYFQKRIPPNAGFPEYFYNCAFRLTAGQYDGPAFATELARVLSQGGGDTAVAVTYLASKGAVQITSSQSTFALQIFRLEDLQSATWRAQNWYGRPNTSFSGDTLNPANLQAANGMIPCFVGLANQFVSKNIDLASVRELYVHCSATDNGSLTSCGAMDVLAVIPLNEQWGSVIQWRPYGSLDSEAVVLQDSELTTIRFYLTDAYNRPLPLTESFVFMELSIHDVPTM